MSRVHWLTEYGVSLNGTNRFGSSYTDVRFTLDRGLLSAPEVKLLTVNSSTKIDLKWKHQCAHNVNYRFTCLKSSLNYTINLTVSEEITPDLKNLLKILKAKLQFTVNGIVKLRTNREIETGVINIPIPNLMPKTKYTLSMRQMMKSSIGWSEPTVIKFETEEAEPYRGPYFNRNNFMIHKGSCLTQDNKHGRLATIYWKGLGKHNGGNGIVTKYIRGDKEYPPDTRELLTECIPNTNTTISMWAATEKGTGSNSSLIVIPDTQNLLDLPTCLVRVRQTLHEPNKVNVNWRLVVEHLRLHNTTDFNITIYWCRLVDQQCREFDWIDKVNNHSRLEYTLEKELDIENYKFGLAVSNRSMSSGILWADCLLGHLPPHKDDVLLLVSQQASSNSAKVDVIPRCQDKMRMIESVNLTYCQDGRGDTCFTPPPIMGHCPQEVIVKLKPESTYTFALTLNYSDTPGITPGPAVKGFSLKEDTKTIIIICVVTVLTILVAVAIAIALYYIQRKRKLSKELRATVVKPSLDLIEPDTESIYSESEDGDKPSHCIGYRIVDGGVPFILQAAGNDCSSSTLDEPTIDEGQMNETTKLVQQRAADADINGNQTPEEVTSDYGTGTDNSGNSLGYTKVTALLSEAGPALDDYIRTKELSEQMTSSSGCLDNRLEDLDLSTSDGPLFKGITLQDVMSPNSDRNASFDMQNPTDAPLTKSVSTESVPTPLNSGYVQVDRIVDKGSDSNLADDYLRVHHTDIEDMQLEPAADPSDAYRNMKTLHLAAPGDFNSAGTIDSSLCDTDDLQSGHSAIDMTQFLR